MERVSDSADRAARARSSGGSAPTGRERRPATRELLAGAIGNAAIGRLLRSPNGAILLRRVTQSPTHATLTRDVEPGEGMDVVKGRGTPEPELDRKDRPSSARFWDAYKSVSYAIYHGEEMKDEVWKIVGGSVGDDFQGGNTCATRVSWAFNNLGWQVRPLPTPDKMFKVKFFYNNPKVKFNGKAGDGKWYIVGAPDMESYLTLLWGRRDAFLKTNDEAKAFEGTLSPGQIAIFAGAHHSGAIMGQDASAGFSYHDAYVESDPEVMPVSAWKLPI